MAKSRKAIRPLITLILACLVLSADTKTVIKSTDCITRSLPSDLIPVRDCSEATATRYVKDENERTEIHASATMYQPAFFAGWITTNQGVKYDLDFDAKIYTKETFRRPPGLESIPPLAPPPIGHIEFGLRVGHEPPPSSKTTDVYMETIDMGERKEFFGKTAHHLILRTRIVPQAGACEKSRTVQREGWYIPVEAPHSFVETSSGIGPGAPKSCVDKYQIHGRFPFLHTMAETDEFGNKREILEISHAPLDPKLFEPPPGFKLIDRFPRTRKSYEPHITLDQRIAFEINSMVREITSWFH
jgi:hypothetical protein